MNKKTESLRRNKRRNLTEEIKAAVADVKRWTMKMDAAVNGLARAQEHLGQLMALKEGQTDGGTNG